MSIVLYFHMLKIGLYSEKNLISSRHFMILRAVVNKVLLPIDFRLQSLPDINLGALQSALPTPILSLQANNTPPESKKLYVDPPANYPLQ